MLSNIVFVLTDPRWGKVFWCAVVAITVYKVTPWKKVLYHLTCFIFEDAIPFARSFVRTIFRPYIASGIIATITAWLSNRADAARNWNVLRVINAWATSTREFVDGLPNPISWKQHARLDVASARFVEFSTNPANGLVITDKIADTLEIVAGVCVVVFAYYARDKMVKVLFWAIESWNDERAKIQKEEASVLKKRKVA